MAEPTIDAEPPPFDPEIRAALETCMEHQVAGRLDEARAIADEVLGQSPDDVDALHLSGLIRFAQGEASEGVALVRRALELSPRFMVARGNLAVMLRQTNREDDAAVLLRGAAKDWPDDPEALLNHGFSVLDGGDAAAAAELFLKAVHLAPDNPMAHAGLGGARLAQQRFLEAEASMRQALGLLPAEAQIHMNLAVVLHNLGKHDEAIGSLRVALLLRPNYPEAQTNLGLFLLARGRTEEALDSLRQAIASDPRRGEAHFAIGQVLRGEGDMAGAVASLRRALEHMRNPTLAYNSLVAMLTGTADAATLADVERQMMGRLPDTPAHRIRLSRALARAGQLDAAVDAMAPLAAADGGAADVLGTIAAIRYVQGRYAEARQGFQAVLTRVPGEPVARTTLAMMQLTDGNYADGLAGFEARFDMPQLAAFRSRGTRLPELTTGPALEGKRVLLTAEQGQGDTLQFVRYAKLLAARGASVLLEVQAPLVPLLAAIPGLSGVSAQGSVVPRVDFTCPMMSLPLVFGTRLDSIPADAPYLAAPAERRTDWVARLGAATPGRRRVGLCWSGNPGFSADQFRSIPLAMFTPLLDDPALEVHLAQTDIREGDDAVVAAHSGVADHRRALGDFADTAALLEQLDLVIAVDTAVAHLAGALGRPVWILLPYGADWRWLSDRGDSPWYPTARLFRQTTLGDWQPVLAAVRAALRGG